MSHDSQPQNEPLLQLFESHGVEARIDGPWIQLPKGKRARAEVFDHDTGTSGITMVQLDVAVELWPGRAVIESCAGFGQTRKEAVDSAFASFAQSALHPILVAFLHTDHEVIRDAWDIGGTFRAITIGEVGVRGTPPGGSNLDMGWFRTVETKLKQSELTGGTHWVRVYYAQQSGETLAKEVLLDNEPWAWMQEALGQVTWPTGEGFFSMRLFLVIQGGLDVSLAASRMIERVGRPDSEIGPLLENDGADPREVKALLAFVPIAFGRLALQELPVRFSDTAVIREREDSKGEEIRLMDEPIFADAHALAQSALTRQTMSQDQFLAVALRSAEVHAVNQALTGGAEAKDLVVNAPVITLY